MDITDTNWYKTKVKQYQPRNTLWLKSTIDWFRKRKSVDTREQYLYSEEELK
jgi:hypothetical protein